MSKLDKGMTKCIAQALFLGFAALCLQTAAPQPADMKSSAIEARVQKLLSQMTLEEKIYLIQGTNEDPAAYQGQAGYLAGVPRLGVPGLRFADGPPGVLTRDPSQGETATMGVAATFSMKDAKDNGVVIGREDRALGIDVSLQPFVNIDRDLVFLRSYNTFGEDPFLTGEIGAAEINGIQSQHVMAQVKHFVAYDANNLNTFVDDQALHEVYIAPFDAAVKAGVSSIMCSYNHVNGPYACGNASTLTKILRDELGFAGFVTSDWGANHSAEFINAGLDMEMPGTTDSHIPRYFGLQAAPNPSAAAHSGGDGTVAGTMLSPHMPEEPAPERMGTGVAPGLEPEHITMAEALRNGSISESTINRAAARVLREIICFGYMDGMQKHSITEQDIDANAKIIEKTGEDAAVLLKNEGGALPLKAPDLSSVVLIGPTAGQVDAIGINEERSVGLPWRQVGPLEAMRKISGNPNIRFAVNDDMTGTSVPAAALSHDGQPGLLRANSAAQQSDAQIDFTTKNDHALPPDSTVDWKGTLTVSHGGKYWLYLQALGTDANFSIDGKLLGVTGAEQGGIHGDILQANQDNAIPTTDGLDNLRCSVKLAAGPHEIEIHVHPDTSHAPVQVRLNWYTPEQRDSDHQAAIAAAKEAKIAVVFLWTRLQPVFGLPGEQDKLVEEVAAVNPNTIVVLNTSQPVALPWANKVKAILEMWWPGDEGGWSTARLLLGKSSPAGRLPVTWAKRLEDYPASDPRFPERSSKGVDGKTIYSEGVNVGYRWFDKEKIDPLYPFGYGLSYTTFAYSGLKVEKSPVGGLNISFTIKNRGAIDADEVPQVYLGAPSEIPPGVRFPVRALTAFDRVYIAAGESKIVELHITLRQLQYWSSAKQKWVTATGNRTLSVGASSRDLRLEQSVN
ncbi:MAG: glycoside hydrolase family 3 protein [Candidatus Binataceae bacterium]